VTRRANAALTVGTRSAEYARGRTDELYGAFRHDKRLVYGGSGPRRARRIVAEAMVAAGWDWATAWRMSKMS
jgi:hypothetical protein